jgi:putative ABC transport system ATP-binding protein
MLELKDAVHRYRSRNLDGGPGVGPISMNIAEGDFMIITGANGSGKSTLLKLIDGSLPLQSGEIFIRGCRSHEMKQREIRKEIARVFQDPALGTVSDFSVLENFRMASLRGRGFNLWGFADKNFRLDVQSYLKLAGRGFDELLDRNVSELSGGQRQVLTVLMNLYQRPSLLLLDEPTAALDASMSKKLLEILEQINRELKITMVMISHDLRAATTSGNRLIIMKEGLITDEISGERKKKLSAESLYGILHP